MNTNLEIYVALLKVYSDNFYTISIINESIMTDYRNSSIDNCKTHAYSCKFYKEVSDTIDIAAGYALHHGYNITSFLGSLNLLSKFGNRFYIPSEISSNMEFLEFLRISKRMFSDLLVTIKLIEIPEDTGFKLFRKSKINIYSENIDILNNLIEKEKKNISDNKEKD